MQNQTNNQYNYTQAQKDTIIQNAIDAVQQDLGQPVNEGYSFAEENFIEFIVGAQKLKLQTYRHKVIQPKALVILFHGLNSYLGSGAIVAQQLAQNNVETVGFDYRGFGKSQGQQAVIDSIDTILQDATQFAHKIKDLYKNIPIFVAGLSLGGLVSYLLSHQMKGFFKGVILFAPALRDFPTQKMLKRIVKCVGGICPTMKTVQQQFNQANKNLNCGIAFKNNQFSYTGKLIIGSIRSLLLGMDQSQLTFNDYEEPFICFIGLKDKMVDPFVCCDLYNQCKSKKKQLIILEDVWHNLWGEAEIFDIMKEINEWINSQLQS